MKRQINLLVFLLATLVSCGKVASSDNTDETINKNDAESSYVDSYGNEYDPTKLASKYAFIYTLKVYMPDSIEDRPSYFDMAFRFDNNLNYKADNKKTKIELYIGADKNIWGYESYGTVTYNDTTTIYQQNENKEYDSIWSDDLFSKDYKVNCYYFEGQNIRYMVFGYYIEFEADLWKYEDYKDENNEYKVYFKVESSATVNIEYNTTSTSMSNLFCFTIKYYDTYYELDFNLNNLVS